MVVLSKSYGLCYAEGDRKLLRSHKPGGTLVDSSCHLLDRSKVQATLNDDQNLLDILFQTYRNSLITLIERVKCAGVSTLHCFFVALLRPFALTRHGSVRTVC